jgi:hypothetical protein
VAVGTTKVESAATVTTMVLPEVVLLRLQYHVPLKNALVVAVLPQACTV